MTQSSPRPSRGPPVPPVHVKPLRIGVEFDRHAVRQRGVDHLGDIYGVPFPLQQQPAGQMPEHSRPWMLDRADDPRRHFRLALAERGVHDTTI